MAQNMTDKNELFPGGVERKFGKAQQTQSYAGAVQRKPASSQTLSVKSSPDRTVDEVFADVEGGYVAEPETKAIDVHGESSKKEPEQSPLISFEEETQDISGDLIDLRDW